MWVLSMLGILYFTATWCGPCKVFGPTLNRFAEEQGIDLEKVDVEIDPYKAAEYDVMSLPTIIWFKDGQPRQTLVGAQSYEKLMTIKQQLEG